MTNSNQKIIAAAIIGVLLGLRFHSTWERQRLLGRDAYLIQQGKHFDNFLATPHNPIATTFGALVSIAVLIGAYELISLGLNKFFKPTPSASPADSTMR
jgi:hypothetical protein